MFDEDLFVWLPRATTGSFQSLSLVQFNMNYRHLFNDDNLQNNRVDQNGLRFKDNRL